MLNSCYTLNAATLLAGALNLLNKTAELIQAIADIIWQGFSLPVYQPE